MNIYRIEEYTTTNATERYIVVGKDEEDALEIMYACGILYEKDIEGFDAFDWNVLGESVTKKQKYAACKFARKKLEHKFTRVLFEMLDTMEQLDKMIEESEEDEDI
tara:strand:- start:825 stop:1142 length:318 start_codon:yes stop_codon:yes gene_type:complete